MLTVPVLRIGSQSQTVDPLPATLSNLTYYKFVGKSTANIGQTLMDPGG